MPTPSVQEARGTALHRPTSAGLRSTHQLDLLAQLGQQRLGPVQPSAQVGRQEGPPHRGVEPDKELVRPGAAAAQLALQHPAHGADVVALVGVAQVARVGRQRRQRVGLGQALALLQHDDVVAAIVLLREEEAHPGKHGRAKHGPNGGL